MATKTQINSFIKMIAPIAQRQAEKHQNKIFASVCIAQACCESAYGTSPKMKNANALFGIKVGKSKYHFGSAWKDKAYSTKTKECYDGKTYTSITDLFRAYDSIEEATEDYYDMLCTASRYKYALNQTSPYACIIGIQRGPFATSPVYVSTIMSIINTYNLTQYDHIQEPRTDEEAKKEVINYKKGFTYVLHSNMFIRETPGGAKIDYSKITSNAKLHALEDSEGKAILRKGTRVTCKGSQELDGAIWVNIPSGWICGTNGERTYIL